jgi:hypothetical protein
MEFLNPNISIMIVNDSDVHNQLRFSEWILKCEPSIYYHLKETHFKYNDRES